MLRRFYTVMIVPHEGGALHRMSVSVNFLVSMAAVFLFCFVSSAFLAHFFLSDLHRPDGNQQALVDVERLEVENARMRSEMQQLVLTVEDLTARMEEYAGLSSEWDVPTDQLGMGGPWDGEEPHPSLDELAAGELHGDWRGMVRAAQDKAEFWKGTLEEQICDRSAFLRTLPSIWPVQGRLTSGYSWRRDPITGGKQFHAGVDIAAPHGTDVVSPADGVVVSAGREGGYGNLVRIDHQNGIETVYAHLRRIHVDRGQRIARGDVLGEVGSTGRSTGPHLHYEVLRDGRQVNPRGEFLR